MAFELFHVKKFGRTGNPTPAARVYIDPLKNNYTLVFNKAVCQQYGITKGTNTLIYVDAERNLLGFEFVTPSGGKVKKEHSIRCKQVCQAHGWNSYFIGNLELKSADEDNEYPYINVSVVKGKGE